MENIYNTDLLLNMLYPIYDLYPNLLKSLMENHTFIQVSRDQYKFRVNI